MTRPRRALEHLATVVALFSLGCASTSGGGAPDDAHDPWEGMNRGVFWFNEKADRFVLEPAGTVWDFILPDFLQKGVRNIYDTAKAPVIVLNDLLQLKLEHAAEDTVRFGLNATLGILGFFDAAGELGFEKHNEDFGQTLGFWGVPPGPYLVLPLLGPSSPRDAVGLAVDSVTRIYPYFLPLVVNAALTATDVVNRRSLYLEEVRENREEALDYYVFVRNAYVQFRENQVRDAEDEDEADDDGDLLYYPLDLEE